MSKYLLSDEESGRGESTNSPLVKDKVKLYHQIPGLLILICLWLV